MALHSKWSSGDLIFYDGTQDILRIKNSTGGIIEGEDGYGLDYKYYGNSTGAYMLWDASADALTFAGGAGFDLDADLDITAATAHTQIDWGTTSLPIYHKFNATTGSMIWESSGARLLFDEADIAIGDTDFIKFGDSSDITMDWDSNSFNVRASTGNIHAPVELGTTSYPLNIKFTGTTGSMIWESSGARLLFNEADITLGDDDLINLGDSPDIVINWTSASSGLDVVPATAYVDMRLGSTSHPLDVKFTGTTGSMIWGSSGRPKLTFDQADIVLGDDDYVKFGDTPDMTIIWTSASSGLDVVPATAYVDMNLGSTSYPLDVKFTGTTGSMIWGSSGRPKLTFDQADIVLGDDDYVKFGDTPDMTIIWTSASSGLDVVPATANVDLRLGSTSYPLDVVNTGNITYRDPTTTGLTGTTGELTLTTDSNRIQFVKHTSGYPCVVTLPPVADCAGIEFKIVNKSTGSSGHITIESTGGNHVAYLATSTGTTGGGAALVFCDGINWGAMTGFASTY